MSVYEGVNVLRVCECRETCLARFTLVSLYCHTSYTAFTSFPHCLATDLYTHVIFVILIYYIFCVFFSSSFFLKTPKALFTGLFFFFQLKGMLTEE